jgi:hypothetical protein
MDTAEQSAVTLNIFRLAMSCLINQHVCDAGLNPTMVQILAFFEKPRRHDEKAKSVC